jgi:hypothetical protein
MVHGSARVHVRGKATVGDGVTQKERHHILIVANKCLGTAGISGQQSSIVLATVRVPPECRLGGRGAQEPGGRTYSAAKREVVTAMVGAMHKGGRGESREGRSWDQNVIQACLRLDRTTMVSAAHKGVLASVTKHTAKANIVVGAHEGGQGYASRVRHRIYHQPLQSGASTVQVTARGANAGVKITCNDDWETVSEGKLEQQGVELCGVSGGPAVGIDKNKPQRTTRLDVLVGGSKGGGHKVRFDGCDIGA